MKSFVFRHKIDTFKDRDVEWRRRLESDVRQECLEPGHPDQVDAGLV